MIVYKKLFFCFILLIGQDFVASDNLDDSRNGLVIVLQGTTSAGKSSIQVCLETLLQDYNVCIVRIDDFIWKSVIEEAKLLGFIHENISLDEIQKTIMINKDIIFAKFKENNWIEPKKELHRAVKKLASEGKIVLVDTVHGDGVDYADFLEQTKDVKIIACQIYCSSCVLAQHVAQRNNLIGYAEKRDAIFTLQEYCRLYQVATLSDRIDQISIDDVQASLEIILQDLQSSMPQDIVQKKLDEIRDLYERTFFLHGSTQVAVASKYPYDFVVNTGNNSSEECAQLIYKQMQKYLKN